MRITTVKHAQKKGLSCSRCGDEIKPSRNEKQDVTNKRTGKTKKKLVRVLGDSYRWIKFNRGPTVIRCMKPGCRFRQSDMTTSDKLSRMYGAMETAEDAVGDWDGQDIEDLKTVLDDMANEIGEVAEEYGESADNIEQAFTGGSATADECREKQENLDGWKDELESAAQDLEEWDGPDPNEAKCETCGEKIVRDDKDAAWEHDDLPAEDNIHDPVYKEPEEEAKNSSGETREEWIESQRNKAEEAIGNCPL